MVAALALQVSESSSHGAGRLYSLSLSALSAMNVKVKSNMAHCESSVRIRLISQCGQPVRESRLLWLALTKSDSLGMLLRRQLVASLG